MEKSESLMEIFDFLICSVAHCLRDTLASKTAQVRLSNVTRSRSGVIGEDEGRNQASTIDISDIKSRCPGDVLDVPGNGRRKTCRTFSLDPYYGETSPRPLSPFQVRDSKDSFYGGHCVRFPGSEGSRAFGDSKSNTVS